VRRPRGRTPDGLISRLASPTWVVLIAGWAIVAAVLVVLIAQHRLALTADSVGAAVSAASVWLALVLLANAVDELAETIRNTPEADRRSRKTSGWRPPWGPVAAALVGILLGWLGWK
jgi:hypothetical protein